MNKGQRKQLHVLSEVINVIIERISIIRDEEDEEIENVPDGLASGDKYENMISELDTLNDCLDTLETVMFEIQNLIGQ